MILTPLVFVAMLSPVQETPATKTFTDRQLGLSFNHPTTWKQVRTRYGVAFEFAASGDKISRLSVVRTEYKDSKEKWQQLVNDVAVSGRRTVVMQTEETLLAVPLLLTKTTYDDGQGPFTSLQGLLYSNDKLKLNFILDSPSPDFDAAEAAWRSCWASLKTLDNQLPGVEGQPDVPKPKDPPIPILIRPRELVAGANSAPAPLTEVTVTNEDETGTVGLVEGWTVTAGTPNTLVHANLKGTLEITMTPGDAAFAQKVLDINAKNSLKLFDIVTKRYDNREFTNRSSAVVRSVERTGKKGERDLFVWEITVGQTSGVIALRYTSSNFGDVKSDRGLIQEVLLSINRLK